jgi:hypothetical protein
MAKKSAKKAPAAKVQAKEPKGPKVIYGEVEAFICGVGKDKPPIDAGFAKEILGWKEEGKEGSNVKYGSDYLLTFKDEGGTVKVRCTANVNNRPLIMSNVKSLKQEILRGRWHYNSEPIILGKYGHVLNGQHQLIALVLADKEYAKDPGMYPALSGPPTIDKLVSVGVSEDDEVVNTMDTCKPRSLWEVICRSGRLQHLPLKERKVASKALEHAIRFLWVRTGENMDGMSTFRTHSEMVDFLDRHTRLVECVQHITDENEEGRLSDHYLSPGYCAALLYLFATSQTNQAAYLSSGTMDESSIDFSLWDTACDWFVSLASGSFEAIRKTRMAQVDEEIDTKDVRVALLVKAWNVLQEGKKLTIANIALEYEEDEEGWKTLVEFPVVGGIDVGHLDEVDEDDVEPPSQEVQAEHEERKQAVAKTKAQKNAGKPAETKKASTTPKNMVGLMGKLRWTVSDDGEAYKVKVIAVRGKSAVCKIQNGFQGAGTEVIKLPSELHTAQPTTEPAA